LGFDPKGVITLEVKLPTPRYSDSRERDRFQAALLEKIQALPGVESAALGWAPPWDPQDNIVEEEIEVQGQATSEGIAARKVQSAGASPGLFDVLKTPLLRGRFFDERDFGNAPAVAIVSQRLADEHFAGQDPIGQHIRFVEGKDRSPWMTIVGVVVTWKHLVNDASWRDTPLVFRPARSFPVVVRATGNLQGLGLRMQKLGTDLDSTVEFMPGLLSDRLSKVLLYPSFRAGLLVSFGLGALLLAALGLHGVLSQIVAQRTPEFGVRRAVGAQTSDLLLLVAQQGGIPVLAGLAAGVACVLAFSHVLSSMLYAIEPADPGLLMGVSVTLLLVACLAIALPAHRAARVDPMIALRDE
jgi:putative ABC transport system permease protein